MLLAAIVPLVLVAQSPSAGAAELVPDGTVVLARLRSLEEAVARLGALFAQPDEPPPSAADVLALADLPGGGAALDLARPWYVALAFPPDLATPTVTWIVPTRPGVELAPEEELAQCSVHVAGDYTAITLLPGRARPAAPSALLSELSPGLLAVHVDLASLCARFRPLIDVGLRQAELGLAQTAEALPFDLEPVFEWYLEFARDTVASAEALTLGFELVDEQLVTRARYRVQADSAQVAPPFETTEFAELGGLIDPLAPLQLASNARWSDFYAPFADLVEALLALYPEALRAPSARLLDLQAELAPVLLPGFAMSGDWTPTGVRTSYVLRASDPGRVLAGLEELLRVCDGGNGWLAVGAPVPFALEGATGRSLTLELRRQGLEELLVELQQWMHAADPASIDRAHLQRGMEGLTALFGAPLHCVLAARGERVVCALSSVEAHLRDDVARLLRPALASSELVRLGSELPPGAAGIVYHVDQGRLQAQMSSFLGLFLPVRPEPLPTFALDYGFAAAVREREYSATWQVDLSELVAALRALEDLDELAAQGAVREEDAAEGQAEEMLEEDLEEDEDG